MDFTNVEKQSKNNALAYVSLVMGILSILLSCCYGIGIVFGIAGLICAIISRRKGGAGVALAGLICSIVGMVFSVLVIGVIVYSFSYVYSNPELMEEYMQLMESYY